MNNKNMCCKCNTCNSLFDISLLETPCPFCNDTLDHKELNNALSYFNVPKLNNPNDFIHPITILDKLPFNRVTQRNYLTRTTNFKHHILSMVTIYREGNISNILTNLAIVWDNDFDNKAFGIVPSVTDNLKYTLKNIAFQNIFMEEIDDYQIKVYNKIVPDECYERFYRNLDEISNSYSISTLFSLYNSINWDILDDRNKHTGYEYFAMNYLLHIFDLIHVPNIEIIDYETSLLSVASTLPYMNFIDMENFNSDHFMDKKEFMDKYLMNKMTFFREDIEMNDYEDVFDAFGEGAIAPNAVGLNVAAQKSSGVFNKLYDLGYRPEMQIYSVGESTSLCPTFKRDGKIYFIECNNNIMKGINEFESIEDMECLMNEVYNEMNSDSIFITIEGLTPDVLNFILKNSTSNKEFLTRLIDLNSKAKEEFIYANTVQDDYDFANSILAEFDVKEMNPQNLFRYGKTFYKLRNTQSLGGNEHGIMFVDKNGMVVGYIIVEDKVYDMPVGPRTFKVATTIEAASDFKSKGIEEAMIDYMSKKYGIDRIECRNFSLLDKLHGNDSNWREIENPLNTAHLFESVSPVNESLVLNEAINANKRKQIEDKVYKVFSLLDKTGANTQKYKNLFKEMSDEKFDKYIKDMLRDKNKNFYLEVLPNKNCPRIKDCKDALDYLKVPTEEYIYYRHDGHESDPIRSRYKVPVLYVNLRRLQQMLSKKNTYSLDISKRNMKTG